MRAALTCIDNNINAFRGQATTATGLKRFNIVCNRQECNYPTNKSTLSDTQRVFLFGFFVYLIQHCFICGPLDYTVSEDAGIESRTVTTSALAVRRYFFLFFFVQHCFTSFTAHQIPISRGKPGYEPRTVQFATNHYRTLIVICLLGLA